MIWDAVHHTTPTPAGHFPARQPGCDEPFGTRRQAWNGCAVCGNTWRAFEVVLAAAAGRPLRIGDYSLAPFRLADRIPLWLFADHPRPVDLHLGPRWAPVDGGPRSRATHLALDGWVLPDPDGRSVLASSAAPVTGCGRPRGDAATPAEGYCAGCLGAARETWALVRTVAGEWPARRDRPTVELTSGDLDPQIGAAHRIVIGTVTSDGVHGRLEALTVGADGSAFPHVAVNPVCDGEVTVYGGCVPCSDVIRLNADAINNAWVGYPTPMVRVHGGHVPLGPLGARAAADTALIGGLTADPAPGWAGAMAWETETADGHLVVVRAHVQGRSSTLRAAPPVCGDHHPPRGAVCPDCVAVVHGGLADGTLTGGVAVDGILYGPELGVYPPEVLHGLLDAAERQEGAGVPRRVGPEARAGVGMRVPPVQ
ncbi:hypothetical protein DVS28_b0053 (plasmid) [Euzebya pacifica]|uniref:Uncharacterized protein n=1 Tax=Euzebya pacifica TaxID=1608957 RepID=A0A346Y5S6_9ACTN|nr:hypothetical protein [Euzebya pacifica]AXV09823.1 hypothetical protein DVS28_b0053 [Euzebya pacifica]